MSLAKRCVKKYESIGVASTNESLWKIGNFIKQIFWMLILPVVGYASLELFELSSNPGMQIIIQNIFLVALCILAFRIRFKSTAIRTMMGGFICSDKVYSIMRAFSSILIPLLGYGEAILFFYPPKILIINALPLPLDSFLISNIWPYCLFISYVSGALSGVAFVVSYRKKRNKKTAIYD